MAEIAGFLSGLLQPSSRLDQNSLSKDNFHYIRLAKIITPYSNIGADISVMKINKLHLAVCFEAFPRDLKT